MPKIENPTTWPTLPQPGILTPERKQAAFDEAVREAFDFFLDTGLPDAENLAIRQIAKAYEDEGLNQAEISAMAEKAEKSLATHAKEKSDAYWSTEAWTCIEAVMESGLGDDGKESFADAHVDHILSAALELALARGLDEKNVSRHIQGQRDRLKSELQSMEKLLKFLRSSIQDSRLPDEQKKRLLNRMGKVFKAKGLIEDMGDLGEFSAELGMAFSGRVPEVFPFLVKERMRSRLLAMVDAPPVGSWEKSIRDAQRVLNEAQKEYQKAKRAGVMASEQEDAHQLGIAEAKKRVKTISAESHMHSIFEFDPNYIKKNLEKLFGASGAGDLEEVWKDFEAKAKKKLDELRQRGRDWANNERYFSRRKEQMPMQSEYRYLELLKESYSAIWDWDRRYPVNPFSPYSRAA